MIEFIGGGGRIRTHGTLTSTAVFKTAAFNHSATPPLSFLFSLTLLDASALFKSAGRQFFLHAILPGRQREAAWQILM